MLRDRDYLCISLSSGIRILMAAAIGMLWLLNLFGLSNIAMYSIPLQIITVVTRMIRNYHERVLPKSRNGRRIKDEANNQLFTVSPPPAYSERPKGGSKHQIPSYQNYSLYGANIAIDWGYNVVDVVQMTEETLGQIVFAQIATSLVLALLHISMFSSIVGSMVFFNNVGTYSTDIVIFFCLGHLIDGSMCIYRLGTLSNAGQAMHQEIHSVRKALSELTVLKFKVLNNTNLFELSVLKEKFEDYVLQEGINCNGYFKLNRSMLLNSLTILFIVNLVMISYKL